MRPMRAVTLLFYSAISVRQLLFAFLLAILAFGGCAPVASGAEVTLLAYVQKSHRWKQDLKGWEGTSRLLESALEPKVSEIRVDEDPGQLIQFLTRARFPGEFRILYLATHMDSNRELSFTNRERLTPDQVVALAKKSGEIVPPDLVIIDCCHAGSFEFESEWSAALPVAHLYACKSEEVTWQIEMNTKQPLYVKKYYPELHTLAGKMLGDRWDLKLSYLGFQVVGSLARDGNHVISGDPMRFFREVARTPFYDEKIERSRRASTLQWFE